MALKIISISIDEETIKKADLVVKNQVGFKNRSHLIEVLIHKEFSKNEKSIKESEAKQ